MQSSGSEEESGVDWRVWRFLDTGGVLQCRRFISLKEGGQHAKRGGTEMVNEGEAG